MADKPPNMRVTGKGLETIAKSIKLLATTEVLVGIPEEKTDRDDDPEEPSDITNAALLYIHETGMPEQNIPARPSVGPAIEENREMIANSLAGIARRVLNGKPTAVESGYHTLGLKMQAAIRNKINDGIPPPLSDRTLQARARRGRKGAKEELERRAAGEPAGTALAKPLVDTAQMRNAVSYAIRVKNRS